MPAPRTLLRTVAALLLVAACGGSGEPTTPPGGRSATPSATPPSSASGTPSATPSASAPPAATIVARRVPRTPTRLAHVRFGTGRDAFGLRRVGDLPTSVPIAVAVRADGEIVVLDPVHARLARFGPDGRRRGLVPLPTRTRDPSLADLVYDAPRDRLLVLDDLLTRTDTRQRILVVARDGVRAVPFESVSDDRGVRGAGYLIGVAGDGTVYGDGHVPVVRGDRAVPPDERALAPGAPTGAGFVALETSARDVRVTLTRPGGPAAAAAVTMPGNTVDAVVLPSTDGAVWLWVNVTDERDAVRSLVVRVDADLRAATYFDARYDPPGDMARPAAVGPDGVVVLTGARGGMDLLAYR